QISRTVWSERSMIPARDFAAVSDADLRRLLELGIVAAEIGRVIEAEKIFAAVRLARPSRIEPLFAQAFLCLSTGRLTAAADALGEILQKQTDSDFAKAILGLVRTRQGMRFEGESLLQSATTSRDLQAAEFARQALQETQLN